MGAVLGLLLLALLITAVILINNMVNKGSNLNKRGLLAYEEGNYKEALELFDEALSADGDDPSLLLNKAITLTALKRYEEATDVYDKVLISDIGDALREKAERGKAVNYLALGDTENAVKYLEQLENDDNYGDTGLLGLMLFERGDYEGAEEKFTRYLEQAPPDDFMMRDVLFDMMCISEYRLDWNEAKQRADALLALFPDDEEGIHEATFIESRIRD